MRGGGENTNAAAATVAAQQRKVGGVGGAMDAQVWAERASGGRQKARYKGRIRTVAVDDVELHPRERVALVRLEKVEYVDGATGVEHDHRLQVARRLGEHLPRTLEVGVVRNGVHLVLDEVALQQRLHPVIAVVRCVGRG